MSHLEIIRLTPSGRGAVASFLLCGKSTVNTFLLYWHGKKPVNDRPVWGHLQLTDNGICEEAVVHMTADDALEIHVHGGEQVASAIKTLFQQHGAVLKTWQEHFIRGTSQRDLALQLLPFAPTERTAQILLDQYNGVFDREMSAIEQLSCNEERNRRLQRIQELAPLGKHLVEPFRVVLAGASNVGKSSLLNAILGFKRSLVYSLPGTTRDVVSGQTALDGFPITFFDTAGFRETSDTLERQGINCSLLSLADAELVVWVIDPTVEESLQPLCPVESNVVICYNKIDLADARAVLFEQVAPLRCVTGFPSTIGVSALTGEGIETLLNEIVRCLIPFQPKPGEAVLL